MTIGVARFRRSGKFFFALMFEGFEIRFANATGFLLTG
jgi:hypothetical protein